MESKRNLFTNDMLNLNLSSLSSLDVHSSQIINIFFVALCGSSNTTEFSAIPVIEVSLLFL